MFESGMTINNEQRFRKTKNGYHLYRYSLALTSQFYFCGIPFRLDTAPKCPLNCSYCFAMARGGRRTSTRLMVDPLRVKRKIIRALTPEKYPLDIIDEFLIMRMPIHFGGLSDPFASPAITQKSIELLQFLNEIKYPVVLSTKNSTQLLNEKVAPYILGNKNLVIQMSISFFDPIISKIIEPNIPTPIERINAIKLLSNQGNYIIVRLQPLFPNKIREVVNLLIPALGEAGVKHIIIEFLKLPIEKSLFRSIDFFNSIAWDGISYYRTMKAEKIGREWMLPVKYKWEALQPLIEQIHKYRMTYGAGDYGLNHLGDTDCCCGLDKIDGFFNWNRNNFSYWIKNNRTNVIMLKNHLQENIPSQSIGMYINSHSRLKENGSLYDYLKDKWNRPGTANAPDTFLGVVWKGDYDEEGNCVYFKEL